MHTIKKLNSFLPIFLLESSNSGKTWKVVIIEEGLSKNGRFYPAEVLQKAKSLFERSKVCFYEWTNKHFDHLPIQVEKIRPEGFPLQTAGYLDNVKYETVDVEGKTVKGLTGFLHLFDTDKIRQLKDLLSSAWKQGLKQLLGLSINAEGPQSIQLLNGRPLAVVNSINKVLSVDLVSSPAAGGQLLQLVESVNEFERRDADMFKAIIEALKKSRPELLEGINLDTIKEEDIINIFTKLFAEAEAKKKEAEEAVKKADIAVKEKNDVVAKSNESELETAVKVATETMEELGVKEKDFQEASKNVTLVQQIKSLVEAKKFAHVAALLQKSLKMSVPPVKKQDDNSGIKKESVDELNKRIEMLERENKVNACNTNLVMLLESAGLPKAVKDKLQRRFTGQTFEVGILQEAIKDEKDTLAKLSQSGDIINLGDNTEMEIHLKRTGVERLQASLDLTFGYNPEDSEKPEYEGVNSWNSLRQAYVEITGDSEVSGILPTRKLHEATSGTFSYMLGYTLNRRMLQEYKGLGELWRNIANVVSLKDFKMQELIRWGGFGVLPTVISARTTQGTSTDTATPTYPELGFPVDTEQLYAIATKGGMVTITRRAIINDDLRQLRQLPLKLARAANRTLNQFVFDLMLGYTTSGINAAVKWPDEYGTANQTALYATMHNNYQTTALGFDALKDLLTKGYYQGEDGYKTNTADTSLASGTTTINVTAGTGQYFKAGDIIRIGGEYIRVDDVNTDALTVTRGIFGTTAAAHNKSGNNYPEVWKIAQILGLENATIWVPKGIHATLLQIANSQLHPESAENAINTLKGAFKPMTSPYLRGDENNYYISYGKEEIDLIELGFLNGKESPEILVQDQPTVGNVFVYDTIRYKVRHEYGGIVPDYRAFAAGIVA